MNFVLIEKALTCDNLRVASCSLQFSMNSRLNKSARLHLDMILRAKTATQFKLLGLI